MNQQYITQTHLSKQAMVPVILSHNPAGSSTQTLFHFAQGYTSGQISQVLFYQLT